MRGAPKLLIFPFMSNKRARKKIAARKRRAAAAPAGDRHPDTEASSMAETDTGQAGDRPARPFLVWIISIYLILNGAYAIVLTIMLLSGLIALEEDLTAADYLFSALYRAVSALAVIGGISLLRYRKYSYVLFLAATGLLVAAHALFAIVTRSWHLDPDQLLFYLPDLLILVVATIYSRRLVHSGYLD
ncbi:MAG: hypothetical protein C4534_10530 [Gaiellales bacterium]|nr:MAG: hypothetical protein C4534_10530 [Gaiellales bacterium]